MSSEFTHKNLHFLEWSTDLPLEDQPRESPVFLLKGNEWFFRFVLEKCVFLPTNNVLVSDCVLYLELKNKRKNVEPCRGNFKIGFKDKEKFDFFKGDFDVYEHCSIWYSTEENLKIMKPVTSKWIKFMFYFEEGSVPILLLSEEKERQTETNENSRTNIHLDALSRDFSKMLDESTDYDVEVRCVDETFQAHRNVLGMRSPVFSAMLNSNMVEGKTGLINVEDINASIFRNLLRYLYSGTLPEFSVDIAKQLYEISDRYSVKELKKACSEYLANNLSEDNVCEILVLADQHSDQDFRKTAITYMIDKKIPEQDSHWLEFCESHSKLANQVMIHYIRKDRSK